MDRDVYLILIGAGISLATSVVTLILQFLLNIWNERIRAKREGQDFKMKELRKALLDKSEPVRFNPGDLILSFGAVESDYIELGIPKFLRRMNADGVLEPVIPVTPSQFWRAVGMGLLILLIWTIAILSS